MHFPRPALLIPLLLAALVLPAPAREKEFVLPRPVEASALPAHDAHPNERLTLGADAYDTPEKLALFHLKMREHNVLPVLVVFSNAGDQTVTLNRVHFELVTRDHAKADPFTLGDLERAFSSIRPPNSRPADQLPWPLPGKNKAHGGLSQRDRDDLEHAIFAARAVQPHGGQQGFLFFDSGDLDDPAQGARLYATGLRDAKGQEMMYFEVRLK
jgi:hypothetical protein